MNFKYNNQTYLIPDDEIDRSTQAYHISIKEACIMWLEDEGILQNQEQEKLCEEHYKLKLDKEPQKKKRKTTVKKDDEKIFIIEALNEFLENLEGVETTQITNESKLIEFIYNNHTYKLDLVKTRAKKEK
jgi:hypothetical protein